MQDLRAIINDIKRGFAGTIKEIKSMVICKEHKFVFLPV